MNRNGFNDFDLFVTCEELYKGNEWELLDILFAEEGPDFFAELNKE